MRPPQKVGGINDPIWAEAPVPAQPNPVRGRQVAAVALAVVAVPVLVAWARGICWESVVISASVLAAVLLLLRVRLGHVALVVPPLAALALVLLVGWSWYTDRSVDVFGPPANLSYCGRSYQEGSVVGPSEVSEHHVHEVAVVPSGSAVLALGCDTTLLWVQLGGTTYRAYDLEGGP